VDRILVIDDDAEARRAVGRTLELAGYDVVTATDGGTAMEILRAAVPGLVVLDLHLPARSSRDVCREIRSESTGVPILVLSAASDVREKILLLELWADDYMTKPFDPREFLARVRAVMRRVREAIV
jgi:DNA-binding response OmpR family regulator